MNDVEYRRAVAAFASAERSGLDILAEYSTFTIKGPSETNRTFFTFEEVEAYLVGYETARRQGEEERQ